MKKLLLLALSVTAAVSLTACGGSVKEIDELQELLNGTDEVVANYSVGVNVSSYDERHFHIVGDNAHYYKRDDTAFEATSTSNNFYGFKVSDKGVITADYYNRYDATDVTTAGLTFEQVSSLTYDFAGLAYNSPLNALETELQSTEEKFELKSKYFSFDKEEETYYFVNPQDTKEDQQEASIDDTLMTIKFTYDDKKELTSVVVTYDKITYTYTNFGKATITMPGTPAPTTPDAGATA